MIFGISTTECILKHCVVNVIFRTNTNTYASLFRVVIKMGLSVKMAVLEY